MGDTYMTRLLGLQLLRDEEGATMVEYAFMVGLVALVALVAVSVFGKNLSSEFSTIATTI
jgi:pilus assembly protein Flp/PilA